MPRGKELEQLPVANTLAGIGEDHSKHNREIGGITGADQPQPALVKNEINKTRG